MKFGTRLALTIVLLIAAEPAAWADSFTEILRTAALKNGLVPAAQLFNDKDSDLADIGKRFFESKNVSLNGNIACQTCHLSAFGSADGLPNAIGILGSGEGPERALSKGRVVPRNTLPFWGRGGKGFDVYFWDGKVDFSGGERLSQFGDSPPSDDALVTAVHLPPIEIREMLVQDATISPFVREAPTAAAKLYRKIMAQLRKRESSSIDDLAKHLGKPPKDVQFLDVARSIAAFIRSEFRLRDTKFQRFVFGTATLSPDELQGGLIFYGKGKCVTCHTGPYFSDFSFHAVPFPQLGFGKNGFGVDYGRFNVTFRPVDLYKFRTPPLFNVEKTAPYGHCGSLMTLKEAIATHFDPLRFVDPTSMDTLARHEFFKRMAASGATFQYLSVLSDEEVSQVESFLKTLSFDASAPR